MQSTRPWARTAAPILAAAGVILAGVAATAHGQSVDRFPPAQRDRAVHAARAALDLLADWFGPSPLREPSLDEVPARWLAPERDRSLERAVIGSVTRQYWLRSLPAGRTSAFEEAVIVYAATRAIHHRLEGSNFAVARFFGGMVPFPLPSVLLSPRVADPRPRVWRFDELPADAAVLRMVRALQTLERYLGWPAMAQSLAAMRESGARLDAAAFAGTVSAVRGADLRVLIGECFRPDAVFDYAVGEVRESTPDAAAVETTLTVVRQGSGVFEAGSGDDPERTVPMLLRFADGRELRDRVDGRAERTTLVYTATARLAAAAIDPEAMLLLDEDRGNNVFNPQRAVRPLGVRLALHWMSWLQQIMLAWTVLA